MKGIWMSHLGRIALVTVIVLAVGIYLGCSSEESADTQTTEEPAAASEPEVAAEDTGDEVAPELLAYANPKPGVCPSCGMTVAVAHVKVATIDGKEYACCSDGCVTMLTENPDKYLKTDSPEQEGHEGHDH